MVDIRLVARIGQSWYRGAEEASRGSPRSSAAVTHSARLGVGRGGECNHGRLQANRRDSGGGGGGGGGGGAGEGGVCGARQPIALPAVVCTLARTAGAEAAAARLRHAAHAAGTQIVRATAAGLRWGSRGGVQRGQRRGSPSRCVKPGVVGRIEGIEGRLVDIRLVALFVRRAAAPVRHPVVPKRGVLWGTTLGNRTAAATVPGRASPGHRLPRAVPSRHGAPFGC